jgi:K(+)-stimulated pyrophosphate-energized sodium pump
MITLASLVIDPIGYLIIAAGIIGLGFSFWNSYNIEKLSSEDSTVKEIANNIKSGVSTFIVAEYKFLALFVISLAILAFFYGKSQDGLNGMLAVAVIIGAASSSAASYFSRQVAGSSNDKIVAESQKTYSDGYRTTFSAGISVGLINASSVIVGLLILFFASRFLVPEESEFGTSMFNFNLNMIAGFTFGASSVAVFSRLGGGIFAKSAEKAEAEIVEKETGITEKSPYNPASVANETGQVTANVGGIGTDIFESFTAAIIASVLLGTSLLIQGDEKTLGLLSLPLIIASIGIFSSIAGSYLLRSSEVSTSRQAINIAEWFAAIVLSIATFFAIKYTIPSEWEVTRTTDNEVIITTYKSLGIFWSAFFGIVASVGIGYISNYFTSKESQTVKNLAGESKKGIASTILGSTESGLISTGIPVAVILVVVLASYYFAGFYGVGLAAVGFLGNMGLQTAFNAFAPVADNTDSVASKAGLDEITLKQTYDLKLTGSQSIAQGKVFLTIASSLASLAIFSAFIQLTGIYEVNLVKPLIISSLIVGTLLPFLLSSNALAAVRRVSKKIVNEVNRQFNDIPALKDANEILDKYNGDLTYATEGEKEIVYSARDSADNEQCIEIAAYATIWETLIPGIIAITVPVLTAYLGGAEMLAAMLLGVISTSTIMALYQSNKGSVLENTKYALEEGTVYNGELIGKESDAYQASVVGDKVGKPVKDTAAAAMTVLMKIMIITALLMVPLLINKSKKKKALQLDGLSKVEQVKESLKEKPNTFKF